MSNIVIDIAAEFTGKKAFKQADSASEKLGKSVKKLAGAIGLAFGTQQVVAFGKASIKAFADDEAAATRLTKAVENLGLGFEDARIQRFISDLEATASVADDVLRPAFQSLISTTGSVTKSQELLRLALDVAAGTGTDAAEVSKDLSLAYLGQTKSLAKYNTGLTKAELAASDFGSIQAKLNEQYSGQNASRLDTYSGKLSAVQIAYGNLQETVGGALIDAFMRLAGDTTVEDLTESVDNLAESLAAVVELAGQVATPFVGLAKLFDDAADSYVKLLYKVTGAAYMGEVNDRIYGGIYATKYLGEVEAANAAARKKAEEEAAKRARALAKLAKDQAAAQAKIVKDKRIAAAIDKANLMLGKGEEVFDIEKIQLAAALTNQAKLLGEATSASQVLQIANDTARLNVKRSILALEDAIAAKDEQAIIAATNKLNADLKVLNALTGQNTQMKAIESILNGLKPKELIDQKNLDEALRKIREMLAELAKISNTTPSGAPKPAPSISGLTAATTIAETNANVAALGGVITQIQPNLKEFTPDTGMISGISPNGREFNFSVTVNTGVGDPNAIAEAIDQVLIDAVQRGTLRGGAY